MPISIPSLKRQINHLNKFFPAQHHNPAWFLKTPILRRNFFTISDQISLFDLKFCNQLQK
ncbi:MAG: hypothetical protein ACI8XW_001188, partial [Gammaproteobacteria bacterium]